MGKDSEFRKKNVTSRKGRVVTQKTREKISNSLRGKPKSEEHRTELKMVGKKENKNIVYITRNKVMSTKHEEKV